MQEQSRAWLLGFDNPAGRPFRVLTCQRALAHNCAAVAVLRHVETGRAKYSQLQRCGSGWTCPVCETHISEVRRAEIAAGMNVHTAAGGSALMVTLTHSHGRDDDLSRLVKLQSAAMRKLTSWTGFKEIKAELGLVGTIRARETTFGESHGWHPHIHDLWLITATVTARMLVRLRRALFKLWKRACELVGLPLPSERRGVTIKQSYSPQEYLAKFGYETKWGSSRELTKSHSKKGRGDEDRYTPFDLLRGVGPMSQGRRQALWIDYARAMYGISQVGWSPGLKRAMRIKELTDDQIVKGGEEAHTLITLIGVDDWREVLRAGARARVLDAAEQGGAQAVGALIESLKDRDGDDDARSVGARQPVRPAREPRGVAKVATAGQEIQPARQRGERPAAAAATAVAGMGLLGEPELSARSAGRTAGESAGAVAGSHRRGSDTVLTAARYPSKVDPTPGQPRGGKSRAQPARAAPVQGAESPPQGSG